MIFYDILIECQKLSFFFQNLHVFFFFQKGQLSFAGGHIWRQVPGVPTLDSVTSTTAGQAVGFRSWCCESNSLCILGGKVF